MKLINADALKQEIRSNADLGQWDAQEVIKIIDTMSFTNVQIKDNDLIIFQIDPNADPEDMLYVSNKLKALFPNNEVIGLVEGMALVSYQLDQTIEYLEDILQKLKGRLQ